MGVIPFSCPVAMQIVNNPLGIVAMLMIAMAVGLVGCGQGDPHAGSFARAKPSREALIGDWRIASKSTRPSSSVDFQKSKLSLHSDGTFEAVHFPNGLEDPRSSVLSGSGRWNLNRSPKWWVLELRWLNRSDMRHEYIEQVNVRDSPIKYQLHYTLGDPDEGMALTFDRVE